MITRSRLANDRTGPREETTGDRTGMLIGGVTAFGIGDLRIYVDSLVMKQVRVVMGGGNRSSKLLLNPNELTKLPNVVVVENLAMPRWAPREST